MNVQSGTHANPGRSAANPVPHGTVPGALARTDAATVARTVTWLVGWVVPWMLLCGALWSVPAGAASTDRSLGTFRDWRATRYGSADGLACMAFSQPTKSTGDYSQRGDAFVFVTRRPAAGDTSVSVETGYEYQAGDAARVTVDTLTLSFETDASTAWLGSSDDTQRLIAAMRAGREMQITGTSSRGTQTVDQYSLYGFSAAYDAIGAECKTP